MCAEKREEEGISKGNLVLPVRLTSQDVRELCKQYRLRVQTEKQLSALAALMQQTVRVRVYYCRLPARANPAGVKQLLTAMTLGSALDERIDTQLRAEQLTEAYLTDLLAGRLLMKAYRIWNETVLKKSGIRLGRFQFIGDEIPLERMEYYLSQLEQQEITLNSAMTMMPSKSVLFLADFIKEQNSCDQEREEEGGFSCSHCANKSCPNRNDHP